MWARTLTCSIISGTLLCLTVACSPTVKMEAPKEPIEINMNVKIEHEIKVKVEKDVETLLENKPGLF